MGSTTPDAAVKFTYEDYLLFPEDGLRHEIIDGEHEATPSPLTRHQRIVSIKVYRQTERASSVSLNSRSRPARPSRVRSFRG